LYSVESWRFSSGLITSGLAKRSAGGNKRTQNAIYNVQRCKRQAMQLSEREYLRKQEGTCQCGRCREG
jgi:hypothetical protein